MRTSSAARVLVALCLLAAAADAFTVGRALSPSSTRVTRVRSFAAGSKNDSNDAGAAAAAGVSGGLVGRRGFGSVGLGGMAAASLLTTSAAFTGGVVQEASAMDQG